MQIFTLNVIKLSVSLSICLSIHSTVHSISGICFIFNMQLTWNKISSLLILGFLAELIQERSLDECIRGANYAANFVIRQSGCSLPTQSDTKEHSICF